MNVLQHDGTVSNRTVDDLLAGPLDEANSSDWFPWRSDDENPHTGDGNGGGGSGNWIPPAAGDDSEVDSDGDGIANEEDNCPNTPNADQTNSDSDQYGDACDNCDTDDNEDQANSDSDEYGDACDTCPEKNNPEQAADCEDTGPSDGEEDSDRDGIADSADNCPGGYNPDQTDHNGNGDYCDDYQEANCEFPMPELDGWHIRVKALNGGETDYPINDLNNPWVRLAPDQPDDDCLVNIEIEDAGGTDFDSRVRLERLSDGNILLEYSWIAGDGTYFWHWVRDPEGNVHLGGENGVRCPANSCGTPHVIGTVIIPGNQGMEYCNCNPGTAAPEPPDGVASWKGYNLGGGEHIGSSDLDDLVFERFLPSRASGGIDIYTNEEYGTNDDPLWQQLYFSDGGGFTLAIPVDNPGTYRVTFYVAHPTSYNKGRQDIALEGGTAVSAWDTGLRIDSADYGTDEPRPLQRTATVEVTDGTLDVAVTPTPGWYGQFDYTMLSAIKN